MSVESHWCEKSDLIMWRHMTSLGFKYLARHNKWRHRDEVFISFQLKGRRHWLFYSWDQKLEALCTTSFEWTKPQTKFNSNACSKVLLRFHSADSVWLGNRISQDKKPKNRFVQHNTHSVFFSVELRPWRCVPKTDMWFWLSSIVSEPFLRDCHTYCNNDTFYLVERQTKQATTPASPLKYMGLAASKQNCFVKCMAFWNCYFQPLNETFTKK